MPTHTEELKAGRLINPERQARGDGCANFSAAIEISGTDCFGGQYFLGSLGMRADNQRVRDRLQPPSRGNARDLPRSIFAITGHGPGCCQVCISSLHVDG